MVLPPPAEQYNALLTLALEEDVGAADITSEAIFTPGDNAIYDITARDSLTVCGFPMVKQLIGDYIDSVTITIFHDDGSSVAPKTVLARISGKTRVILQIERVALNLLQRLSSIATETKRYIDIIGETECRLLDTRKTLPGWRVLEKYAVAIGGAGNHRIGLFDAFMIKDNHIAAAGGLKQAVDAVRRWQSSHKPSESSKVWHDPLLPNIDGYTLTVECDTLEQAQEAMRLQVDRLLLDNISPELIEIIVAWRDKYADYRPVLEASGGITKENARIYAATGIDYISSGAVTSAAAPVDIGLDEATS